MKKLITIIFLLALIIILVLCRMNPPSAEDIESFVAENRNCIILINEYLLELEDRDAYISDDDGSILIALENQTIEDDAVREAIMCIWKKGCFSITKHNTNNAIVYTIWKRTIGHVDCGFVYAIDHSLPPKAVFQTELSPLSEEGWYYYLADYEGWRLEHEKKKIYWDQGTVVR